MNNIIVSLTTYKERLIDDHLDLVIKSILDQQIDSDINVKIVLTIDPEDIQYISPKVKSIIDDNNVEILFGDNALRAHKKYFYVMQKYRDCPIVTVDDDAIYEPYLLQTLINKYKEYPRYVIARRAHLMRYHDNGVPQL